MRDISYLLAKKIFMENNIWLQLIIGPAILLIAIIFKLFQPKKINYLYGYRTSRSMKSQEAWKAANRMSANAFLISALIVVTVQSVLYFVVETGIQIGITSAVLVILLAGSMPYVENYLKKNFDENGKPVKNISSPSNTL